MISKAVAWTVQLGGELVEKQSQLTSMAVGVINARQKYEVLMVQSEG